MRDPVAREEVGDLRWREPVPAGDDGAGEQGRRPLRAGVRQAGHAPGGLAAPARVPRDARQRARRPLRILVHRRRAVAMRGAGGPAVGCRHQDGDDRDPGPQALGGRADLGGHLAADARPGRAGCRSTITASAAPELDQHVEGRPELRRGGGGEQIDRIAHRGLRRGDPPQRRPDGLGELHDVQPVLLARVRAEDPGPAGVGEDGDPVAPRQRLARQERREVEELAHRAGPDHARLTEAGALTATSDLATSAPVCAPAARAPAAPRALFTATIGVERERRRATRANVRGFPKDSRYSSTTPVAGSVLPEAQEVVAGQVGLVADRDEGREADPELARVLQQRDPQAAALREHPHVAARRHLAREGRVEQGVGGGVDDAQAVRPHQAHAGRPADLDQLALDPRPLLPDLGEAGREDHQRVHPSLTALPGDVQDRGRRHRDDGEIDRLGQIGDPRQRRHALHPVGRPVDRVQAARVSAGPDVVQHLPAHGPPRAGGAHDHRPTPARGCAAPSRPPPSAVAPRTRPSRPATTTPESARIACRPRCE